MSAYECGRINFNKSALSDVALLAEEACTKSPSGVLWTAWTSRKPVWADRVSRRHTGNTALSPQTSACEAAFPLDYVAELRNDTTYRRHQSEVNAGRFIRSWRIDRAGNHCRREAVDEENSEEKHKKNFDILPGTNLSHSLIRNKFGMQILHSPLTKSTTEF